MSTLVNTIPEGEFHFNSVNFIYKNIFIVDAKVKELVYSGNTVIFLLPSRECIRENNSFGHLHNQVPFVPSVLIIF